MIRLSFKFALSTGGRLWAEEGGRGAKGCRRGGGGIGGRGVGDTKGGWGGGGVGDTAKVEPLHNGLRMLLSTSRSVSQNYRSGVRLLPNTRGDKRAKYRE